MEFFLSTAGGLGEKGGGVCAPPGCFKGKTIPHLSSQMSTSGMALGRFAISIQVFRPHNHDLMPPTHQRWKYRHIQRSWALCRHTSQLYLFPREISEGRLNLAPADPRSVWRNHTWQSTRQLQARLPFMGGQEWERLTRRWTPVSWLPRLYSTVGMNCFCN